jgi:DNA-binding MarR family transcriptional regulator
VARTRASWPAVLGASSALRRDQNAADAGAAGRCAHQFDGHAGTDAFAEHRDNRVSDSGYQPSHDLLRVRSAECGRSDAERHARRRRLMDVNTRSHRRRRPGVAAADAAAGRQGQTPALPEQLRSFDLAPRHLSLLSLLLLDGPLTVSQLAAKLNLAPTTVSLIVGDLNRKGVLVRDEDQADRRRRIIDISPESRPAISQWLSPGARALPNALTPLTPGQRRMFVDTLLAYESAFADTPGHASTDPEPAATSDTDQRPPPGT